MTTSRDVLSNAALPETTVRFTTAESRMVDVQIPEINQMFEDLESFDRQFNAGTMLARQIISEAQQDEPVASSLGSESDSQQITAFFVQSKHRDLLHDLGLSAEPITGGAVIMDQAGHAEQAKMILQIKDKDTFLSFLGALKPEQTEHTGLKKNLEKIPMQLREQIVGRYNLQVPEPEAMELFMGMDGIIAEYKRLGMTEAVLQLEPYYFHGMQGDLREFVSMENRGLFTPPEQFSPSRWQTDASPEYLEKRWTEGIDTLEKAMQNPKARELCDKTQAYLEWSVAEALKNLPTLTWVTPENMKQEMTILEVAQQKLQMLRRPETTPIPH